MDGSQGHGGVGHGSVEPAEVVDPALVTAFDEHGFAVLHGVLDPDTVVRVRQALVAAAEASEARGIPTRMEALDPGGRNVRVYDLVEYDPVFGELLSHPLVVAHLDVLLGADHMVSNFSANIALPGSGSMNAHCDQSTVMPEPWTERWTMNAIWCLDDVAEANGATRYLPGSHRYQRFADVPADPKSDMVAFEAAAGSVILMDGRLWHTSGENRTPDRERALLFAFHSRSFLRLQNNWWQSLSADTRRSLDPALRTRLGLTGGNMVYGTYLAE